MKKKINNGIFYVVISLVAVLGVASVVVAYSLNSNVNVNDGGVYNNYEATQDVPENLDLGAVSGPDSYQWMNFHAGFQSGGKSLATSSTAATYTLASKDIPTETTWLQWTVNVNTTVTTMSSSSAAMINMGIPTIGDTRVVYLYNASSTAAASLTLAAGTGVDLQQNEDNADLAILGLDVAKLTFIRKPNTDVMLILDEFTTAD